LFLAFAAEEPFGRPKAVNGSAALLRVQAGASEPYTAEGSKKYDVALIAFNVFQILHEKRARAFPTAF